MVTLVFLGTTCIVETHPPQGTLIMPLILFAKFVKIIIIEGVCTQLWGVVAHNSFVQP